MKTIFSVALIKRYSLYIKQCFFYQDKYSSVTEINHLYLASHQAYAMTLHFHHTVISGVKHSYQQISGLM